MRYQHITLISAAPQTGAALVFIENNVNSQNDDT